MIDQQKSKQQLIEELAEMRQRVAALEGIDAERKNAAEALRLSESRYRALAETTRDIIFILDRQGTLLYANQAAAQCIGICAADIVGKRQVDLFPPDMARSQIEKIQCVFASGEVIEYDDLFHFGPAEVWLRIHLIPIRDEAGQITSVMGVCHNITVRKRAEEALQRAHDELEQRVKERTAELAEASESLRQKHSNLKHLLHSSDHERQLIAYEIHDGLAQQLAGAIMQFQAFAYLKDKNRKEAAKAYEAGLTMLQHGHFEARRLIAGVRPPILDEAGVVEAVAHLVHEIGREQGPKVENRSRVDFDRLDPTLENAIYRIAQEALTNAYRHSKSKKIRVSLSQREDRIRIAIRDWGVGFDPEAVPKNRFGLEGIRQRARLLGGKCNIRSKAGQGARVSVELPVVLRDEDA